MIREIVFDRQKYGHHLMVDVGAVRELQGMVLDDEPHRLDFYDLLLVTDGHGTIFIDETPIALCPGRLVITSPGQVRRLVLRDDQGSPMLRSGPFNGMVLFFLGPFALDFFNDPYFLHRLELFHPYQDAASLQLDEERARWFYQQLVEMRSELRSFRGDSEHLLRARLYETLIVANRWFAAARRDGKSAFGDGNLLVLRFLRQLETVDARRDVAWHARALGVSTTYLRRLTRIHLGSSPGALVRRGLLAEAKRRLLFSGATVAAVADSLGFADPSYFGRFFKREAGATPGAWRRGQLPSRVTNEP